MVQFEWTISVGNLLSVIGFGISGIIFVMMMRADMMVLSSRVTTMEEVLKTLAVTATEISHQRGEIQILTERINVVSRRLDWHMYKNQGDDGGSWGTKA